jgi:hypothetical protein
MIDIPSWTALAQKVRRAGLEIFATASVPVTEKRLADEKVLALTLLARTLSNLKSTLLLLRERQVVEARTITRCCYENMYWVVGLAEEGQAFARKMGQDDMHHRRERGQFIFDRQIALESNIEQRLREWLRNVNETGAKKKESTGPKALNPSKVAELSDIGRSYVFYSQLSSDSGHPSVTALGRYVIPHTTEEVGGIDVDPVVSDKEIEQTLELLCQATIGVCIGVNQMLGGTDGGSVLNEPADEYVALSNKSASRAA